MPRRQESMSISQTTLGRKAMDGARPAIWPCTLAMFAVSIIICSVFISGMVPTSAETPAVHGRHALPGILQVPHHPDSSRPPILSSLAGLMVIPENEDCQPGIRPPGTDTEGVAALRSYPVAGAEPQNIGEGGVGMAGATVCDEHAAALTPRPIRDELGIGRSRAIHRREH